MAARLPDDGLFKTRGVTTLLDPGRKVAKGWDARTLPASFIVGPDGRIRYSLVGELNWDHEHVVKLISELVSAGK